MSVFAVFDSRDSRERGQVGNGIGRSMVIRCICASLSPINRYQHQSIQYESSHNGGYCADHVRCRNYCNVLWHLASLWDDSMLCLVQGFGHNCMLSPSGYTLPPTEG